MTIQIQETINNIYDENRVLLSSKKNEVYLIKASEGKVLKCLSDNKLCGAVVCVNTKNKIKDYTEVSK